MNNDLSNTEKKMISILENNSHHLDKEDIWNTIENKLPSKRKKRILPWFLFSILSITLISYVAFSINFSNQELSRHIEKLEINKPKGNSKSNSIEFLKIINDDTLLKNATTNSLSSSMNIKVSVDQENTYKSTIQNQLEILNIEISSDLTDHIKNRVSLLALKNKTHKKSKLDFIKQSNNLINTKIAIDLKNKEVISEFHINRSVHIPISRLNTIKYSIVNQQKITTPPISKITILKNPKKYYSLTFRLGVTKSLNKAKLRTTAGEFDSSEFEKEKNLVDINSQLFVDINHSSGWTYGLGFGFSRITTRYSNKDINAFSYTDDFGLQKTTVKNNDLKWHRNHTTLDILFHIRKNIFTFKNINIESEIALGYNIWAKNKGYYFINENSPFTIFKAQEVNPYKNKMGVNSQLALPIRMNFTRWSVSVIPSFKISPSTLTKKSNFYQIKNSQFGLQISVAYQPNWEPFN